MWPGKCDESSLLRPITLHILFKPFTEAVATDGGSPEGANKLAVMTAGVWREMATAHWSGSKLWSMMWFLYDTEILLQDTHNTDTATNLED